MILLNTVLIWNNISSNSENIFTFYNKFKSILNKLYSCIVEINQVNSFRTRSLEGLVFKQKWYISNHKLWYNHQYIPSELRKFATSYNILISICFACWSALKSDKSLCFDDVWVYIVYFLYGQMPFQNFMHSLLI